MKAVLELESQLDHFGVGLAFRGHVMTEPSS